MAHIDSLARAQLAPACWPMACGRIHHSCARPPRREPLVLDHIEPSAVLRERRTRGKIDEPASHVCRVVSVRSIRDERRDLARDLCPGGVAADDDLFVIDLEPISHTRW